MRSTTLVCVVCAAIAAGVARADPPGAGSIPGRVLVSPISVGILVPTVPVREGRDFRIRADVANAGTVALQDVAVRLVRPAGITLRDPARQDLPRIAPGGDRRVQWDACARNAGSYVVMVRATDGPFTSESAGAVIQVTPDGRSTC